MLTELMGLLQALDVMDLGGAAGRFTVNLNRNRIGSISRYSSRSIFYFKTIVSDQCTPEEVGMVSRVLEKSYASFVVACINLMPFHRVRSNDSAAIDDYLNQFHQNMGISSGNDRVMSKLMDWSSAFDEAAKPSDEDIRQTGEFLLECWERAQKTDGKFIEEVMSHWTPLHESMKDPIDPITRAIGEKYRMNKLEIENFGFLGEATEDDFGVGLDPDEVSAIMYGDEPYDDELDPEGLNQMDDDAIASAVLFSESGDDVSDDVADTENLGPDRQHEVDRLKESGNLNEVTQSKKAVSGILSRIETVSNNKIKSCRKLGDLRRMENSLKSIKNKYVRYLNRYKKNWKQNEKTGKNKKLAIRFEGMTIKNPKGFMKRFGRLMAKINQKLKLIADRRQALGGKATTGKDDSSDDFDLHESTGIPMGFTEVDFLMMDRLNEEVDTLLMSPVSAVFPVYYLNEAGWRDFNTASEDSLKNSIREMHTSVADIHSLEELPAPLGLPDLDTLSKPELVQVAYGLRSTIDGFARKNNIDPNSYNSRKELYDQLTKSKKRKERELESLKRTAARRLAHPSGYDPHSFARNPDEVRDTGVVYDRGRHASNINVAAAASTGFTGMDVFDREIFTSMDMKKANEAIPTFAKARIGFIVDETEQVVTRNILIGVKCQIEIVPAKKLVEDIYQTIINKRKFLKFIKWATGEEKSLADLLFGIKELKDDALKSYQRNGEKWSLALSRRRKRWAKTSVPYLMREYCPNVTIVMTMSEIDFIKSHYGLDVMTPAHVEMIMDQNFLLGFVVLDQSTEMGYIAYDGHGGEMQAYTYNMLERERESSDRMMRELYRSMARN